MAQFQVNYLGCGSATPTMRHLPSCQVIDFRGNLMVMDCGEGAQLSMRRRHLKYTRLNHIFLSHLHGDHCLGLPGLVSTLALTGKDGGELNIHTFKDGIEILRRMIEYFCHKPPFEVKYHIVDPRATEVVLDTDSLTVTSFPLYHGVPAVGYIFSEKPKLRHLRGDMIKFFDIPVRELHAIKSGADFVTPDGRVISNERLTTPPTPSVSYAYCSDTLASPRVAEAVAGVDTLYHEATYLERDAVKAAARFHSTAAGAARVARDAAVGRLVLGHYSKSYRNDDEHLAEARAIFPNTILSHENLALDLL